MCGRCLAVGQHWTPGELGRTEQTTQGGQKWLKGLQALTHSHGPGFFCQTEDVARLHTLARMFTRLPKFRSPDEVTTT